MQFPESWLREFCNPPLSTAELAELLTMSGMEVEELRPVAPPFSSVVVAEVLSVEPHPNADKLRVCLVNIGAAQPLQIVCGAVNVRIGIKVPCALVGAELPPALAKETGAQASEPFKVRLSQLRGIDSHGMLCSASELHLPYPDAGGLLELDLTAPVGINIREHLDLDDTLFTLKLTPNLGHVLSVYGVAREVAALTGASLKVPKVPRVEPSLNDVLPVSIEAHDLCGRFSGRIVREVNARACTPQWMVDRLARCGQRSVSPLVDISNYVMFEWGQPSHIFDLDYLHEGLTVRWARPDESLKLLNGQTIDLDGTVGIIADTQAVESLAGIMGGSATAVSDNTKNIYIEAAFWWPQAVAGRSRRFNFSTDAGHRYERGVDPRQTVACIERLSQLVLDICGGQVGPLTDQIVSWPLKAPISLRVARAAKVIGMPVTQFQCSQALRRLGLHLEEFEGILSVEPPSWRFDLQIEEDLIEEVIRVLGFHQLPSQAPLAPVEPRACPENRRTASLVRHAMAALDYFETINFSFVEKRWESELAGNPHPIKLLNPISAPLAVMRSSLMGSLIGVLRHNLARRASRVRVFEIGRVFHRDDAALEGPLQVKGLRQPVNLGGLAFGPVVPTQWSSGERIVDFFDVKGDLEALFAPKSLRFEPAAHPALHPGRSASIVIDGQRVGFLGELHPRWRQAYDLPSAPILFEISFNSVLDRPIPVFAGVARQQSVWRDLAVLMPQEVSHDQVINIIRSGHTLVRSAVLFDLYKPEHQEASPYRSLAVRLELHDETQALTDDRIETAVQGIINLLTQQGGRLRG
ncbi:MAG: phenylalanine--tRNA ligase subunit beta [Burkholderiales bacterium]